MADKVAKIGHAVIDAQHQSLFTWLERLESASKAEIMPCVVGDILGHLQDYVEEHFETEERLMRRVGYPYIEQHCQEHAQMRQMVTELSEKLENHAPKVTVELVILLNRWLVEHINQVDAELGHYIIISFDDSHSALFLDGELKYKQ